MSAVTTLTYSGGIEGVMADPVTSCIANPTPDMPDGNGFARAIRVVGSVNGISRTLDLGFFPRGDPGWAVYEGLTPDMATTADTFSAKYFFTSGSDLSRLKERVGGAIVIRFTDLGGRGVPPMTVAGVVVCP